jgi:hypothetical protein
LTIKRKMMMRNYLLCWTDLELVEFEVLTEPEPEHSQRFVEDVVVVVAAAAALAEGSPVLVAAVGAGADTLT